MPVGSLSDLANRIDPALILEDLGLEGDPWQEGILRSAAGRTLILSARQVGKSTTTAALALWTALYQPGSLTLLLSPSLRQSNELYRKVKDGYSALGRPVPAVEDSATTLTLATASRVVSLPCSEATIRGFSGVDLLILDEAARVPDPLYLSVLPMLAISRGRLIALSTPFGKRGWFHDAWSDGSAGWHRVKVVAADCPRLDPAFLAEQRALLGERWYAQEWCCSFEETEGQYFSTESILAAYDETVKPLFGG